MKKTIKFVENPTRDKKDINRTPTRKDDSNNSKKNMTAKTNTVSQIPVSDSDQSMDIEDNDIDSMGWRGHLDIATTSKDSDLSDTDGTE